MNKVQKIEFTESGVFKEKSTLTFFDENLEKEKIPKVFFLVGNNGSGKSSILKSIHDILEGATLNSNAYISNPVFVKIKIKTDSGLQEVYGEKNKRNENIYLIKRGDDINLTCIFDKIQTNFKTNKIESYKSVSVDEEYPDYYKERDLSIEIPQLLITLYNKDNEIYAKAFKEGKTEKEVDKSLLKLERFKKAFEHFYQNKKTFSGIRTENGETKIIFKDINKIKVDMNTFSTGEKQIIFRVGNLLRNLGNLKEAVILIDEPETSLHPTWQKRYLEFLLKTFEGLDIQFIIATHSPYILQGMKENETVAIKIDRNKNGEIGEKIGYYPNSLNNPSINLINYLAYGIVDELLHIELFTSLEVKFGGYKSLKGGELKIDKGYENKTFIATIKVKDLHEIGDNVSESLPIYIRNSIHHADEKARQYTEKELEKSINIMLGLL